MPKNLEVSALLDFYGGLLTDKQRETVEYYYNDDLSLGEIAENMRISRQGVRDSIKRSEMILFQAEEKMGLMRMSDELQKSLEEIRKHIDRIDRDNQKTNSSDVINESVKAIIKELDKLNNL